MTSQALTTINHSRPHQTFRVGYDMPALDIRAGESFQRSHYAGVRARLVGIALVPPAPRMPEVVEPEPIAPGDAPLNMHGACSWRFLVALAAIRHGMTVDEVMQRCRQRHVIAARADAITLIYRHTQYSMPGLGRIFELDHTSILNALIKTGSTDKLVEVLPHMDTAKRSKNRGGIVMAVVEPTPIPIPASKPANAVQRIVRAGYRAGKSRDVIAAEAGIGQASVKVIANRMGLKRADFAEAEAQ